MTIDYGPLQGLIGTFKGDKGLDIAPDPEGTEENPYYETITFSEVGYVKNAEEQLLVALHYHQLVSRKSDDAIFHNQTGYWMYDKKANQIIQSIAIPRAVCLLAASEASTEGDTTTLRVESDINDKAWGIVQSPFMHEKATTTAFKQSIQLKGDKLHYEELTMVDIYGGRSFEHKDANTLTKV